MHRLLSGRRSRLRRAPELGNPPWLCANIVQNRYRISVGSAALTAVDQHAVRLVKVILASRRSPSRSVQWAGRGCGSLYCRHRSDFGSTTQVAVQEQLRPVRRMP